MNVAVAAVSASCVVGLLATPATRYISWAGTACAIAMFTSVMLGLLSFALMLAGEWTLPGYTLAMAGIVLLPAWWLGRTPEHPPVAEQADSEPDDESGGGGGGGLRKPPQEPPPAPPTPGLDWDAFDDILESWTREREPERELTPA